MTKKILKITIIIIYLFSCTKVPRPPQRNNSNNILLATLPVDNITSNSAASGGDIKTDGGSSIIARGVCWGTSPSPTLSNSSTKDGVGVGSFSSSINGLLSGKNFYVRAYATNSSGTTYGNEVSFTTTQTTLATITTSSISSITQTTAISGGTISNDGGAAITARGVCWGFSPTPTISNSATSNGTGSGTFSSSLTGLNVGSTYYVRAYAINAAGVSYGNQVSFTTTNVPILSTTSISSVTQTTASSGGNITSDGGATITSRGVCWNTSGSPTISNSTTSNGSGVGSFFSSLTGLTAGTTYYVRAYAINAAGVSYGNQVSFTTTNVPILATTSISSVTQTTASSGGNITSDGGATITSRGVCWNTIGSPTISNSATSNGTGSGTFSSSLTGLSAGSTYYVRAYAINAAGISYGNQVSFSTLGPTLQAPTLISPSNGSSTICCYIYYDWSPVSGATSYEFQLSKNSSFPTSGSNSLGTCGNSSWPSTLVVNVAFTTSSGFCSDSGTSFNNGTWYWRVRALSGLTQGPWSQIFYHNFSF